MFRAVLKILTDRELIGFALASITQPLLFDDNYINLNKKHKLYLLRLTTIPRVNIWPDSLTVGYCLARSASKAGICTRTYD